MRNRSRLLYGIAGLVMAAGVAYACKDFLNVPPQGALTEDVLATRAGVEGTLIAAYRSLDCSSSSAGSWGCAASNWVWGSVTSGDAYKGSAAGDQQPVNEIETYLWSVGDVDVYLNQKWSQVYEGVSRANATLRLLAKVQASKPGLISTTDANGIKGEALFLRAHYSFEAWRMWGNIPYYFETDNDFRKANDLGVDSVAKLIMADLKSAIALLPLTPRNGDKGRATAWTARAYLGRVQAYEAGTNPAYWDSALATLRNVQSAGPYSLETSFDHVWTGFAQYQNGPETIFAYQASVRDGEPSGWNSNWGERLNFPHSGSHFGCCGFHQPSQNLVNFFQVDANGLPLALSSPTTWNSSPPVTRDTNFAANTTQAVDPRLDFTVGRDNVPYKDWGVHKRTWIRDPGLYSGPYSPKKNVQEAAANAENNVGWVPTQTNDVNIHLFRYADMLLLLAEAEVEKGTLANALTIVNQIRARAGKLAQGCGSADSTIVNRYSTYCAGNTSLTVALIPAPLVTPELDTVTTPWAAYRIGQYASFTTQAQARAAVRTERRLELAMEGQRFFDLRRWAIADTAITNYITVEETRRGYLTAAAAFTFPKYAYYPIPAIQIALSVVGGTSRLKQNFGW
jgi:starch-binding outer membrane protein, SusD/RagB family